MSPGTHIKLLLNRLCICTQTEEKEHSQTPTAPLLLPHLLPSPFSFTPLMLRAQRRSKRDGQTMEMWMRAHLVSCPPLSSDEVAQFMFVLYKLCLPQVISVTSDGLRSFLPMDFPLFNHTQRANRRYRRGYQGIWKCWTFLQSCCRFHHCWQAQQQESTSTARLSLSDSLPLLLHRCVSCHA